MFGKSNFNTMEGFDRWFQGVECGYGGNYQDNESPGFRYHGNESVYATDLLATKASGAGSAAPSIASQRLSTARFSSNDAELCPR